MSTLTATVWLLMALITSLPPHLAHSQTPRPGHKCTWQVEATCLGLKFWCSILGFGVWCSRCGDWSAATCAGRAGQLQPPEGAWLCRELQDWSETSMAEVNMLSHLLDTATGSPVQVLCPTA